MRNLILSLLLASAAASPALALQPDPSEPEQARQDRRDARASRAAARSAIENDRSAERPPMRERQPGPRPEPSFADRPERQAEALDRRSFESRRTDSQARLSRPDRVRPQVDGEVASPALGIRTDAQRGDTMEQVQSRFERRQDSTRDVRLRERSGREPEALRRRGPLAVSDTPLPGTQPRARTDRRRTDTARWSTHWRNDRSYDWQNHRRRHRSLFRLGFYYDPFGWNYNRYEIGWRMWPSYYSNRYWIRDPWMYRLPYAPPGYRWIRYWDDALLVDTWSGEVVDSIRNFFW